MVCVFFMLYHSIHCEQTIEHMILVVLLEDPLLIICFWVRYGYGTRHVERYNFIMIFMIELYIFLFWGIYVEYFYFLMLPFNSKAIIDWTWKWSKKKKDLRCIIPIESGINAKVLKQRIWSHQWNTRKKTFFVEDICEHKTYAKNDGLVSIVTFDVICMSNIRCRITDVTACLAYIFCWIKWSTRDGCPI